MARVRFEKATRQYDGTDRPAVDALDLTVEDGELMVLVGPSGCGKTTALRMLAGLEPVDEGAVYIGRREVTDLKPAQRDIAMVFQSYALFPHLTVAGNIGFWPRIHRMPPEEAAARVRRVAHALRLDGLLDRRPAQLSIGERQRVAMGRAMVRSPRVFLLDEPLASLDAKLRLRTRAHIAALQRRLGVTMIYVTHDQAEAMALGDRIAVMKDGVLRQCGTPREVFARPVDAFVAGFVGSPPMNLVNVPLVGDAAAFGTQRIPLTRAQVAALSGPGVTVGVRPEGFEVAEPWDGEFATVETIEDLGPALLLHVRAEVAPDPLVVRCDRAAAPVRGEMIGLRVREAHLFDERTGRRLPDP